MAKRFDGAYGQAVQQAGTNAKGGELSPGQLQQRMRRAGLKYYAECELTMYTKKQRQLESDPDTGLGEQRFNIRTIRFAATLPPLLQNNARLLRGRGPLQVCSDSAANAVAWCAVVMYRRSLCHTYTHRREKSFETDASWHSQAPAAAVAP